MSERNVKIIIEDIIESIDAVLCYTSGIDFLQFDNDRMCRDAVLRNIEVIGEAIKQLPEEFLNKHSSVEWHKAVSMRNRLIHAYFDIDYSIVWETAKNILPEFKSQLKQIQNTL